MENQNLAQRVKELRKRKAMSQDDLAKNSGLSLRTVQRVENGDTVPTAETLKRLALVLEVAPKELTDYIVDGETSKQKIKTKYEYLHIYESKLIFSKTPEINLVEDYSKSITYVFKTLMVFFISIPIFCLCAAVAYNLQMISLFIQGLSCTSFFLTAAFQLMLFTSGTPVIDIKTIRRIRIKKVLLNTIVVEILFFDSGRIKGRGLILQKDQVDVMIEKVLEEKLITNADIKIYSKPYQVKRLLFFLVPPILSPLIGYIYDWSIVQYVNASIFMLFSIFLIIRMLRYSVFLSAENKEKGFNNKKNLALQKA